MGEDKVLKEFPDKQIIIDIPEKLKPDDTHDWIICKVPKKLRMIRPQAYTPQLVSIGPIHYGESKLEAMEHYKTKYVKAFLERASHIKVCDLIQFMREGDLLQRIQGSYAVTIKPVDKSKKRRRRTSSLDMTAPAAADEEDRRWLDSIGMILRDACFIFELFLRNHETHLPEADKEKRRDEINKDYIFRSPWRKAAIKQDLILLENQLPYFFLTQLFDRIFKEPLENYHGCLTKITCEFFIDYYRFGRPNETGQKNKDNGPLVTELITTKQAALHTIKHFTDLVRKLMYEENENIIAEPFTHCLYSAKQLSNAGVVFGRPKVDKFLTDIETDWNQNCWRNDKCCSWRNSWISCLKLKIPPLKVQDNTECVFRNVMALEQFVYPDEHRICSYIYLLDQLINTVEDVDLLVGKKIIDNLLGSNKAVVDLVNKLCDQIVIKDFFYSCICDQLNDHHGKTLNVARSTLRRVYFKDIWTGSSTLLGLVFLVFSGFSVASTIKNLFF